MELNSADFRRLSTEVVQDLDAVKKMKAAQRKLSFKEFSKLMVDCQVSPVLLSTNCHRFR